MLSVRLSKWWKGTNKNDASVYDDYQRYLFSAYVKSHYTIKHPLLYAWGFNEERQQEVLVGAILLGLIRINGSSLC